MEFLLLGPLVVRSGGGVVPVRPGKQRTVLAALLVAANRVVTTDDLAEALWGASPPPSAQVTLQNYVKRLRHALADADRSLISTHPHGYQIRAGPGELDLLRFRGLVTAAHAAGRDGQWQSAAEQAATALELWREDPLADVDSELLLHREVPPLIEMRLQAAEIKADASLHLGRHAEVINELSQLAAAHPLRERFWALLMLALYRSGRQADALAAYQRARKMLVAELGTEPGAELSRVQHRVLTGEADAEDQTRPPAPARARGLRRGDSSDPAAKRLAGPRQLPAPVRGFTGRAAELDQLSLLLGDASPQPPGPVLILAIDGTAGVGKTALAVHWAHQVAARFPDGQLYVNLRGFGPVGAPADPAEAIRSFLEALGADRGRIPVSLDSQAALYRSLLAGKRVLIVLDNALDEQQVRPLLPASPGCLVLVTSRRQMAGLAAVDGARLLNLDVLSPAEARELLARRLGPERAAAEPHAVGELAVLCGRLPLALAITAARAAAQPGHPLSALATELRDEHGRLDALDTADPNASARVVFAWSYQQLDSPVARLFRLAGLHPGPDITIPAAASLTGTTQHAARRALRELTAANVLTEHLPGRYALHDLLRAYAAEQAHHTDSDTDRREATGRVLDHYLHTAAGAALLLDPSKEPIVLAPPRPGTAPEQPADHRQALAWFEAEHQVLLASVTLAAGSGFEGHAWQLPWAMVSHLREHRQERAAIQRTALAAAGRLGNTAAQALSSRLLAIACSGLGDHDQARDHYACSLTLYQRLGNRLGQAKIHQNLSVLAERQGHYANALGHAEQALRLCQAIGDKLYEAEALNDVGWYHGLLGDYQQARAFCRQALTLSAETDDRRLEGHAWDSLGYAEHHLGNLAEAAACYRRAVSLLRETGVRFDEADTLTRLGDTRHAAGELAYARESWQEALTILEDLQHPDAEQVRARRTACFAQILSAICP